MFYDFVCLKGVYEIYFTSVWRFYLVFKMFESKHNVKWLNNKDIEKNINKIYNINKNKGGKYEN